MTKTQMSTEEMEVMLKELQGISGLVPGRDIARMWPWKKLSSTPIQVTSPYIEALNQLITRLK